uniref:Uncharacterized protein n=1 Tax=Panagrolaimus sp. PS1159 TaxID=55785 RepID=A0AC35GKQ8_9BILA
MKHIFLIFIGICCISLTAAKNEWPINKPSQKPATLPLTKLSTTAQPPPINENSDNDDDDEDKKSDSINKIIIGVCVSVGCLILLAIVGIILCVVFREKISHKFFSSEKIEDGQGGAPGNVFYSPQQFQHKGPLKIQKQARVDVNANYQDDKDIMPTNAHFQFTEQANEVYDIGSEVEQLIQ